MAAAVGSSAGLLTKLRRQFEDGKHTDVTIRIRIVGDEQQPEQEQPPAKRPRTDQSSGAAAAADHHIDIKAHVNVLSAQSAYFEKALSGEWTEAAERRVEVTVADEQELEDLKLLIKLSYSDSFTHNNDGQLLPAATRLRLGRLADAYMFVEAVEQVVASIPLELDLGAATACLDELPPALEAHPGIEEARRHVEVWLCAHLGPVASMFEETTCLIDEALPLRDEVKQLSVFVLKRLLMSESLNVQSENEPYALLVSWLRHSPHAEDKEEQLFRELAPLLRYHHMTSDFVANLVSQCPWMDLGLLRSVMASAFVHRDAQPSFLERMKVPRGPSDRREPPSEGRWEIEASFTLEEVMTLEPGGVIRKWCGLVAGYPALLRVQRRADEGNTLGLFFGLFIPESETQDNGPQCGVAMHVKLKAPPSVEWSYKQFFDGGNSYGVFDFFGEPWAEVVREGSPHFPGGKMAVKATVKLVCKDGDDEEEDEEEE